MRSKYALEIWDRQAVAELDSRAEFVLPSRDRAIERVRTALESGSGIIVLTGEPGVGKSWLIDRLIDRLPGTLRLVGLDVSPRWDFGAITQNLQASIGQDRSVSLNQSLLELSQAGERVVLVADEAHNASDAVLEEIRLLSNGLKRPAGLAGLILCGHPSLVRRLSGPAHRPFQSRVGCHVHLRGLDFFEALDWLRATQPSRKLSVVEGEELHQAAMGNPCRMLQLIGIFERTRVESNRTMVGQADELPTAAPRPPIRLEDGLIEVGWPSGDGAAEPSPSPADSKESPRVERVEDLYAELQALAEIERVGRQVAAAESAWRPLGRTPGIEEFAEVVANVPTKGARVRAETQHEFAPFGQLFGRHDSEPGSETSSQAGPDAA
jgi:AAA domain